MFKISKNIFYLIGIVILFSKMFACTDSGGGGCIPLELIPEGYRANTEIENPVLTNVTQLRVTPAGFDFVKDNIGDIVKAVIPDMYLPDDSDGNARLKFCMPATNGESVGMDYGAASACDDDNCNTCKDRSGSCENKMKCDNGSYGQELIITMKQETLKLEARDDNTDADLIYGEVTLEIEPIVPANISTIRKGVLFWVDGTSWINGHTPCEMDIEDTPVSMKIDFVINTLNPAETTFDIPKDDVIFNINLGTECSNTLINLGVSYAKDDIITQVEDVINGMISKLSDTMLCASTVPIDDEDLSQGFECPMNAPASATAGSGCTVATKEEDCDDGYSCEGGYCKINIACHLYNSEDPNTIGHKCLDGFCDESSGSGLGKCVISPYCMETVDTCWKTKLGMDARIDIMGIIGSFIETNTQSWINFYLNLGHYARTEGNNAEKGMTIGMLAGTSSDWNPCVTQSTKDFDKIIPDMTMLNDDTFNGKDYHIGIGISEYFINQLLDSVYDAGSLCLDIDSKVSSMITTDLFGLLLPSINSLTSNENSALMIALRPKKVPFIKLGEGNTDGDGNIIVDQALLNFKMNDLELDFYAFLNDRYVKIFTTVFDLNLGINLELDAEGKLIPVLAPIKFGTDEEPGALNNLRVRNSEILRETDAEIADMLPGIVELAMGMIPLNFDPIALPVFMGFGIDINDIALVVEGSDEETKNFLGLFADILIGVPAPQNIRINTINIENKVVPRIKSLRKGKAVKYSFNINTDASNIEYQYRINKGFWTPFKKGNLVKVENSILKLQGKYNIDFRIREIGKKRTLSKIMTKTIVVDSISPVVKFNETEKNISIIASDNITTKNSIKYLVSINKEGFKEYNQIPVINIPENGEVLLIEVKAIDESGNETFIKRKFNLGNRMILDTQNLESAKDNTGCSYGGTSDKSIWLIFLLVAIALVSRRKNLLLILMASFTMFFYGCSDNTETNTCKTTSDCDNGQVCVDDKCVDSSDCTESPYSEGCDDCYIPGRCTDNTGDNPCDLGCECRTDLGMCFALEGFCTEDSECEDENFECKDNKCQPKRCGGDNDCAHLECEGDHSKPICNELGDCSCFVPCAGGCPTGKFCCMAEGHAEFDECLVNPSICEDIECDPGYSVSVVSEGSIDDAVSCERVGVECECIEKTHLKLGTIGLFAKSAIWNDGTSDKLIVVGYNSLYKDLVLGVYDENVETIDREHIAWSFIDGILNDGETTAEVTNGPTGPRGGVSQTGIDVGQYASLAVDNNNNIHIAYYDKEHRSLRYILVKKHTAIDENDTQKWDISIPVTVDQGDADKDTGYYTSITLDNTGNPAITYMVKEYKDGDDFKSSLNIAVLLADNSWTIDILDSGIKDLPCNNECSETQRCLFNEAAVLTCKIDLVESIKENDTTITIPDNDEVNGANSIINLPSNSFAVQFRISYSIAHTAAGHLRVVLVAPDGREHLLVNPIADFNEANASTPNGINVVNKKITQISNMDVSGNWTLKVYDIHLNTQGTLNSWSIKVKQRRDSSPYCGATCKEIQEVCAPTCSSMGSEQCASDGTCKEEAKKVTAKYYFTGVGLFNKSVKLGNNLGILYYDSIDGSLKFKIYSPSGMSTIDSRLIDSGKAGRSANIMVDTSLNAHITYRDKAGNLRYLEYALTTEPSASLLVDDGLRITEGDYSIHKIGSDSLVVSTGINEYDIYYYDATSREVLKRNYKKSGNILGDIEKVILEGDDLTYTGSFGFYLNYLKLNGEDVFATFYYKTQVGKKSDADYNSGEKPDSLGKVRVIK